MSKPTEQELQEIIKLCDRPAGALHWRHIKQLAQAELDRRATEGKVDVEAWILKNGFSADTGRGSDWVVSTDDLRAFLSSLLSKQVPDGLLKRLYSAQESMRDEGEDKLAALFSDAISFIAGQGQQSCELCKGTLIMVTVGKDEVPCPRCSPSQPQSAPTQAEGKCTECGIPGNEVCGIPRSDEALIVNGDCIRCGHSRACHDRA